MEIPWGIRTCVAMTAWARMIYGLNRVDCVMTEGTT